MSEKLPKQEEMFKPGEVKKLSRDKSLFQSTIKSLGEADLKRKAEKNAEERRRAIDESLDRKISPDAGD